MAGIKEKDCASKLSLRILYLSLKGYNKHRNRTGEYNNKMRI